MSSKKIASLTSDNIFSLIYHHLFEYPLTRLELIKWQPGKKLNKLKIPKISYGYTNGFYYLKSNKGFVFSRIVRKRNSLKKIQIAREVSKLLKRIPFIKMVAITGSLSMFNAKDSSDIDLIVVTKKGRLWTTRLLSILLLVLHGFKVRRWGDKNEENKICINMWMDETNLTWPENNRNFYTAHEIAQIMPLFDKQKTYQMILNKNLWLKDYWPNSVKIEKNKKYHKYVKPNQVESLVELFFYKSQRFYMKNKRTKEVISSNRAIFHPIDRSIIIDSRLMEFFK